MAKDDAARYDRLIAEIFRRHYKKGVSRFEFDRREIEDVASALGVKLPKNLGDVLYSYRFRKPLPASILATEPPGKSWRINLAGQARYRFQLGGCDRIEPRQNQLRIKIPDSTPEIVGHYALTDEQALLAKVRYNRLVDVFLGIAAYSLQNHLRTTVRGIGQIEVDEIYVGVDRHGGQFVVPVQAKGGKDKLGCVQAEQDVACCVEKFPHLACRPVAVQFLEADGIAMFELTLDAGGEIRVVEERHYQLVPASEITDEDLASYRAQ